MVKKRLVDNDSTPTDNNTSTTKDTVSNGSAHAAPLVTEQVSGLMRVTDVAITAITISNYYFPVENVSYRLMGPKQSVQFTSQQSGDEFDYDKKLVQGVPSHTLPGAQ